MTINLIHCSYHKNLTVYYSRVMSAIYNHPLSFGKGYKHFNSSIDSFYEELNDYKVASVNNYILDFDCIGDFRITRFIRDPRDMIISGYFYHYRGAEVWCNVVNPEKMDWTIVNGNIPDGMGKDYSYTSYLQSLSKEEGLIAEIQFRKKHFESMMKWPDEDKRIMTFRYEDIIGNEVDTFRQIFQFYELPWHVRKLGVLLSKKYSASGKGRKPGKHIRDPKPNQWKEHFTPKVNDFFESRYKDLIIKLGYE